MISPRRQARLTTIAILASLAGCAWARPPYADDPLLRRRSGPRPLLRELVPIIRTADVKTAPPRTTGTFAAAR